MLNKTSSEIKALFLLKFTRELIRNSKQGAIFGLKNILKERNEEIKQKVSEVIKRKKETVSGFEESIMKKTPFEIPAENIITKNSLNLPTPRLRRIIPPKRIIIPESKLPEQFQYLKPTPINKEIELGKINPLVMDPKVAAIECTGADKPIMVKIPELKKTSIILNKEEMNQITKKFSEATKIPIDDGIFRVAFGKLIFSATISKNDCLNFTITKIIHEQNIIPRRNFNWNHR
ncbi:MAG: hypothetical protein Q8P15_03470 [Nanoarchaeota archaeon]|nr:hypothetical protein [Nanoarchaeota archaeon]